MRTGKKIRITEINKNIIERKKIIVKRAEKTQKNIKIKEKIRRNKKIAKKSEKQEKITKAKKNKNLGNI